MPAEKIADNGFTAEENAILAEGDDDLGEVKEAPEDEEGAEPEPQSKAVDSVADKAARQNGKSPDGYVPISALHERSQKLKEATERASKAEQSKAAMEQMFQRFMADKQAPHQPAKVEAEIPSYDQDPLGHMKAVNDRLLRKVDELEQGSQKRTQHDEQMARVQSTMTAYANATASFKRQTPDYDDAFQYLYDTRNKALAYAVPDAQARSAQLEREEGFLAAKMLADGINPGQGFYEMAKSMGYKGKQPAVEENKIERLAKGQQASRSNAGGKVADGDDITLEKLAAMDPDSAEFDKAWSRYEKAERRSTR